MLTMTHIGFIKIMKLIHSLKIARLARLGTSRGWGNCPPRPTRDESRLGKLEIMLLFFAFSFTFFAFRLPQAANAGLIVKAPPYIGLNEGLVGFWSFNGPDMSQSTNNVWALDRSGQGNNGQLTNMATSTARKAGKIGQALDFDGVDDNVVITDPNIIEGIDRLSVSFWVKSSTANLQGSKAIMGQHGVGNDPFAFTLGGTEDVEFDVWTSVNVQVDSASINIINDTNWHHVVGVYDGANIYLYIDAVRDANQQAQTGTITTAENGLQFGDATWQGLIDEVRVYNRALTPDEIKRLYKIGSTFVVNKTRQDTLREGLVGHWSFDGADMDGNRALDRSGQGNTGALTGGPKRMAGKIGQALDFDGVNDYVNPDDAINTLFNTLAQGTISAWVKWESGTGAIFSRGNSTFISDGQLKFYIDSSANLDIYSTASSFGSRALDASFALSNPTSWHHVVFTNDTSGNKFYVDGKQTTPTYSVGNASTDFFFDDMPSSIHGYEIGGVVDTDDETFNGLIDDVRIYNRALSEQEIKRLYKIGSTLKVNVTRKDTLTNGLVGHWSFDGPDMNATQALDTTGNANNGTLTNGPKRAIGKLGQALDFDGVDDYVNAGTGSSLSLLGPVTISAWIYPRTFGGASKGRIVGRGTSGIANSVGFSVNNSDITAGLSFGSHYDVLSLQTYSSNNTITLNTWQHVTVTWDGTTDRTKVLFYVNGIKTGRQDNGDGSDGSVTRVSDSTCSLLIGVQGGDGGDCNVDNGTRDFNGQIDEVRIYNRVLSADEIKRLYNMGR